MISVKHLYSTIDAKSVIFLQLSVILSILENSRVVNIINTTRLESKHSADAPELNSQQRVRKQVNLSQGA
jgi:hypothetical protein